MKSAMSLAIALAATAASASTVFSVSNFAASCIPHSAQCSYNFTVIQPNSMETTGVTCGDLYQSDGASTLPPVTDGTCVDSSRVWTITKPATGGLVLSVSQQVSPSSSVTGSYTIPASDLTTTGTGTGVVQAYNGPTSFDLDGF